MPTDLQLLAFKLVLTPLLVGATSVMARRSGPLAAGLLVGLPLTSGPVSVFLALEQGPTFAAEAALGTLAGVAAVAAFAWAYGRLALRRGVTLSLAAAIAAYALVGLALTLRPWPAAWIVSAGVALPIALFLLPKVTIARQRADHAWWEIPLRIVAATTIVIGLTATADALGPTMTGVLSPFPVFATVIGARLHHLHGGGDAIAFLRGVLRSLFSFVAFFLVVAAFVDAQPLLVAYAAGIVAAVAVQAAAWFLSARFGRPGVAAGPPT